MGSRCNRSRLPASSEGSFKSVESIAKALTTTAVCGLARCKKSDIDAVHESTKEAQHRQIHVFLATSPIHLEYKLKMTEEQVLASISENVTYAKTLFEKFNFHLKMLQEHLYHFN